MNSHAHGCVLCKKSFECDDDGCEIVVYYGDRPCLGRDWQRCPTCDGAVAAVDELPLPKPRPLSLVGLVLTVRKGARIAVEAVQAGRQDDALSLLCGVVDGLGGGDTDGDDVRQVCDAWVRIGVGMGARDAWSCRAAPRVPPDLPADIDVQCCYNAGWIVGSFAVNSIRVEMMKHG
jgi:hypothetical protein